jgi:hypothetical protein
MKKWIIFFAIATVLCSCENDVEVKDNEQDSIIGTWELTALGRGIGYVILPDGGAKYVFKSDNTFIKSDLASTTWKEEGTWLYDEDIKQLNFTYRTYNIKTNEVSDTKSLTLTIDKLTDKELVFKADYKRMELGQFIEFQFDYYSKR